MQIASYHDRQIAVGTYRAAWRGDLFVEGYGPTRTIATACDPKRRQELERDFITYHEEFRNDLGVAMPREYLVTVGVRA